MITIQNSTVVTIDYETARSFRVNLAILTKAELFGVPFPCKTPIPRKLNSKFRALLPRTPGGSSKSPRFINENMDHAPMIAFPQSNQFLVLGGSSL
jgi:hypothetical protein|tara:strand:+ start:1376 stop:1663 length:288 start_codon:yes stop_codon:yes gene_type:complete